MGAVRANPAALTGLDTLALTRCRSRDRDAVVKDVQRGTGAAFAMTNVTGRNRVIEYKRTSTGRLTRVGSIRTRGRGIGTDLDTHGGRFWRASAVSDFGSYITTIALQVRVVLTHDGSAADVGFLNCRC